MTDDTRKFELSRRALLGAAGAVGLGSAGAGFGTSALLNDVERFNDNSLTAGTLNLTLNGFTAATNNAKVQAAATTVNEQTADGSATDSTSYYFTHWRFCEECRGLQCPGLIASDHGCDNQSIPAKTGVRRVP